MLHGPEMRAPLPQPRLGSGDANGDRVAPFQHAVERMDGNHHLGRPAPVVAHAQPVADHLLEPADGRLGSSPLRVAGRFLPCRAFVFGDAAQMVVPLRGRSCSKFQPRSGWNGSGDTVLRVKRRKGHPGKLRMLSGCG